MTVKELIERLQQFDPSRVVCVTHPDSGNVDYDVAYVREQTCAVQLVWEGEVLVHRPVKPETFVVLSDFEPDATHVI
jgi:hypothetical protein